jgi:hypothetical protein
MRHATRAVGAFGALGLAALLLAPAAKAAESWGLPGEKVVRFDAKVVDVLCELTGDCPDDCGAGKRQLGLLNGAGKLILPLKNQVPFAGVADELIDFCGKMVTADGLMVTNRGYTFMALQFVREAPDGKWRRANRFTPKWAARNGVAADSKQAKQWFRNDPRVKDLIARQGRLGLGPKADEEYLKE